MFFYLFLSALSIILILLATIAYLILRRNEQPPDKKEYTVEASDLLRDLLNGGAITVTQVIDPSSIFLHSPRDL